MTSVTFPAMHYLLIEIIETKSNVILEVIRLFGTFCRWYEGTSDCVCFVGDASHNICHKNIMLSVQ